MSSSNATPVRPQEKIPLEEGRKLFNLPHPIPRPTATHQCNKMSYKDDNGIEHEIWMPKGTMYRACDLMLAEKWDGLAKFPAWAGQKYEDDDTDEAKEAARKVLEETEGMAKEVVRD